MHINNWVHASDLMKMVKSANSISTFSSEEGLPDNHVITIRERELTVDFPELIQNNIKTDTVILDLDAEWDGIQPVIIFGPNADGTIAVEYTGEPVHIPGAVMQYVGGLDCSVMGLDDSGEVRLVTKAAPNTFEVVESGEYIGQISEDDVSLLGQILSAIENVETATSDASNAAEDATAAADSANTAAEKATDAANSANTAATKATAAANSANTASERAENAYDVLTPIIAEIGVNGNQPRATTNPNYIATASDAYAAKPLEICIKGETRQNLWVNPSGTVNGITATSNEDGTITLSGTSNSSTSTIQVRSYALKPSTQYAFSVDKEIPGGNTGFILVQFDKSDQVIGSNRVIGKDGFTSDTFTTQSDMSYIRMQVYCSRQDAPVSGTYRVMLNEGSEPEPWCPPGLNSVDELSLMTAGKNLANAENVVIANGGTVTNNDNSDGSFDFNVTSDGVYAFVREKVTLTPGTYRFSAQLSGSGSAQVILNNNFVADTNNSFTVNSTNEYELRVIQNSSIQGTVHVSGWQLELGSTATAYEPPTVTQTPIDLDGHTLCSLPDGTHDELTIDATGAVTLLKRVGAVTVDGTDLPDNYAGNNSGCTVYGAVLVPEQVKSTNWLTEGVARGDVLPVGDSVFTRSVLGFNGTNYSSASAQTLLYVNAPCDSATDYDGARSWLNYNPLTVLYKLATPQTIDLGTITLPTLPSPNITVYHDSDVPSDITVEYVQDINIVLDNLNAKIAALNIAQSISS